MIFQEFNEQLFIGPCFLAQAKRHRLDNNPDYDCANTPKPIQHIRCPSHLLSRPMVWFGAVRVYHGSHVRYGSLAATRPNQRGVCFTTKSCRR
jgi:hypothetical protein